MSYFFMLTVYREGLAIYEGVSKSFQTELITKYKLAFGITHWKATHRVMTAKLTRLTHKMIQLHLVAESCTICISCSRRPAWKLLDTPLHACDMPSFNTFKNLTFMHVTFLNLYFVFTCSMHTYILVHQQGVAMKFPE
jgi:hypothetical protein